ncbi:MAG: serine--tRNA ligase, partial [Pseudomonadota bacterium]
MFDIRAIRETPDLYKGAWSFRGVDGEAVVKEILDLDETLRAVVAEKQEAESTRNTNSKLIGKAKAGGDEDEAERLMALVAEAKAVIEGAGEREDEARGKLNALLMGLPNIAMYDVPIGDDESGNVPEHYKGQPRQFEFEPKDHADLGVALKNKISQPLMDFESAAAMSGARFVALRGDLARLERALAAYMLDVQTRDNGYEEVSPPILMKNHAMEGTGQLPKFTRDFFLAADQGGRENTLNAALSEQEFDRKIEERGTMSGTDVLREVLSDAETNEPFWLIPTAEVPLTNLVREQILSDDQLPLRMTAHTPCFRSEAGSAGRDTKGMIRLHQFNKVELVSIVRNEAEGLDELTRMTQCAQMILEDLQLPYRRMLLCTGDMGFGARKTFDLEVWLPSQNTYREISSCSYCGDFQARRMNARYRPAPSEDTPKPKPEFLHTLNGS